MLTDTTHLPGINDEEVASASATTTGLIHDDHLLESQQRENQQDSPLSVDRSSPSDDTDDADNKWRRIGPYLPKLNIVRKYKGSMLLAFLSHACFLTASLFYVKLAFVDLAWVQETRANHVPSEVLDEDDDEIWSDWASGNGDAGSAIQDSRDNYYVQYKLLYVSGAAFFVLVGVLDWMRYCDVLNVLMILAGVAGVASGLGDTGREEAVWDCVSVHLYLLEACNLLRREHNYEGCSFFRLGDVCFLVGSILDVLGSYFYLAGLEGLWVNYTDMTASLLWLACSLIDLGVFFYFLKKHTRKKVCACVRWY